MGIKIKILKYFNMIATINVVSVDTLTTAFNQAIKSCDVDGNKQVNVLEFLKLFKSIIVICAKSALAGLVVSSEK